MMLELCPDELECCRVFGDKFAEMPFVATKEGYRREGNCKRLLKAGPPVQGLPSAVCAQPALRSHCNAAT